MINTLNKLCITLILPCLVALGSLYGAVPRIDPAHDVIPLLIIGSGPAGLAAGLFGTQLGIATVIITGPLKGGLLTQTSFIENYPGVKKIRAKKLVQTMYEQDVEHGVTFIEDSVIDVDFSQNPFIVYTEDEKVLKAASIIIATGSTPKLLGVPGEDVYYGNGVSTCAICDGRFFEGKNVVVVGGGDSAVEEALQLSPHVKSITILVRSDRMRAGFHSQQRLLKTAKVKAIEYNKLVTAILGDGENVTGIEITDALSGKKSVMPVDGVFLAIGYTPNTEIFKDQLSLTDSGHILINGDHNHMSSIPGVFAAGDVIDERYRLAPVAAGFGAMAAFDAVQWMREK